MKKTDVIDAIHEIPNEFDLKLLIEKLVFMEKVEDGLKQAENGNIMSHKEVKEWLDKW